MIRTIISLNPEDKDWLDRRAREERVSIASLVRRAVRHYRDEAERAAPLTEELLRETAGLWKSGDGLNYQRRVRKEWEKNR